MGIQINGQTDTITATDGSFTIQGASGNLTGDLVGNVTGNLTGNVTGNLTGNVTSSGVSTFSDTVNVGAGKSIRLYGASSGYSEIVAAAGSASTTFTLPANGGSASQYLQTDGAGVLSWNTNPALFTSYAIICDEKAGGSDGGTATNAAWRTRDLNKEFADPDGIVSISSNQFTLGAGNYLICWSAPAVNVNRHQTRLRDVTNSVTVAPGTSEYVATTICVPSTGAGRTSITSNTTYEIQHQVQTTVATIGFGYGLGFGETNIFTLVRIFKEL